MDEKKQIEEMDAVIRSAVKSHFVQIPQYSKYGGYDGTKEMLTRQIAVELFNAGYRKQSEGEWVANRHISVSKRSRTIHYETYKCSVCGTWNGRHRQNFCPNCGAHMKGGAE